MCLWLAETVLQLHYRSVLPLLQEMSLPMNNISSARASLARETKRRKKTNAHLFFIYNSTTGLFILMFPPDRSSMVQLTVRLTRPSPEVCQMQRCPSLVLSSPELGTERFLALLVGGAVEGGGCRGLSGFGWPGCRLPSCTAGRQSRTRNRKLKGMVFMVTGKGQNRDKVNLS